MPTARPPEISPSLFADTDMPNCCEHVCSPLNYIGGKFKLLPQLLNHFPQCKGTFVDLFCGGCNVGANVVADHVVFNDNLIYLIDLYRTLKEHDISHILHHIYSRINYFRLNFTNEDGYRQLRQMYNTERNPLDLFVLTAYSFNHQIRFNNSHEYNNPFGRNRSSFNFRMERNLHEFVARIQSMSCEFTSLNFNNFDFDVLSPGDFVYCDPPYLITTGTYNDGKRGFTGWSEREEYELLSILNSLNSRKIGFALSNVLTHKGKTNTILEQWITDNDYTVVEIAKSYSNSNYHTADRAPGSTREVLILNTPKT